MYNNSTINYLLGLKKKKKTTTVGYVGLWLLNNDGEGGLDLSDSVGSNDLINQNATLYTSSPPEGNGWANVSLGSSALMYVPSGVGLPLHTGDVGKSFSFACCVRFPTGGSGPIISKFKSGKRSFHFWRDGTNKNLHVYIGKNDTESTFVEVYHTTALSDNTTYWVLFSYINYSKTWAIRIRNTSGDLVGTDAGGVVDLGGYEIMVADQRWTFGGIGTTPSASFYIDKIALWKKGLTVAEFNSFII